MPLQCDQGWGECSAAKALMHGVHAERLSDKMRFLRDNCDLQTHHSISRGSREAHRGSWDGSLFPRLPK